MNRDNITWLAVYENNMTDELLSQIDECAPYVSFQRANPSIPIDLDLRFNVSLEKWRTFAKNVKGLRFDGQIVDFGIKAIHLNNLDNLEYLYIGASNYPLFENEAMPQLPKLKNLAVNGYGLAQFSEDVNAWITELTKNGCKYDWIL